MMLVHNYLQRTLAGEKYPMQSVWTIVRTIIVSRHGRG